MTVPEIRLEDLSEPAKDFLIAHSATGKSVPQVIADVLSYAAYRAGFEVDSTSLVREDSATERRSA